MGAGFVSHLAAGDKSAALIIISVNATLTALNNNNSNNIHVFLLLLGTYLKIKY